ncbi:hypothetical protein Pelo_8143 [Pelomyxa schiedti]|nr:hypothetical protein Pelo_12199 [Pelomyxa schiedti]KAH3760067.1 hypothetical protein Pelo_8143 [Pelomyxa schiedti]
MSATTGEEARVMVARLCGTASRPGMRLVGVVATVALAWVSLLHFDSYGGEQARLLARVAAAGGCGLGLGAGAGTGGGASRGGDPSGGAATSHGVVQFGRFYYPWVNYTYQVDGVKFSSRMCRPLDDYCGSYSGIIEAEAALNKVLNFDTMVIHSVCVDPADPSVAFLEPAASFRPYLLFLLLPAEIVIALLSIFAVGPFHGNPYLSPYVTKRNCFIFYFNRLSTAMQRKLLALLAFAWFLCLHLVFYKYHTSPGTHSMNLVTYIQGQLLFFGILAYIRLKLSKKPLLSNPTLIIEQDNVTGLPIAMGQDFTITVEFSVLENTVINDASVQLQCTAFRGDKALGFHGRKTKPALSTSCVGHMIHRGEQVRIHYGVFNVPTPSSDKKDLLCCHAQMKEARGSGTIVGPPKCVFSWAIVHQIDVMLASDVSHLDTPRHHFDVGIWETNCT